MLIQAICHKKNLSSDLVLNYAVLGFFVLEKNVWPGRRKSCTFKPCLAQKNVFAVLVLN